MTDTATIQDRAPNFRANGQLYLVRCYSCDPVNGRKIYAAVVRSGECVWCGWTEGKTEVSK